MFVAVDGRLAGVLGVADPIKASTPEAIRLLHAEGLRIVMLTGDNDTTAGRSPPDLGIDEVMADVLPDRKREAVQRLQRGRARRRHGGRRHQRRAGARARRTSASRWARGTDVAIESAGITLVKGDLGGIVRARRLSRRR